MIVLWEGNYELFYGLIYSEELMKMGILTLMASDNCGALLQAYALQNAIEKSGDCRF